MRSASAPSSAKGTRTKLPPSYHDSLASTGGFASTGGSTRLSSSLCRTARTEILRGGEDVLDATAPRLRFPRREEALLCDAALALRSEYEAHEDEVSTDPLPLMQTGRKRGGVSTQGYLTCTLMRCPRPGVKCDLKPLEHRFIDVFSHSSSSVRSFRPPLQPQARLQDFRFPRNVEVPRYRAGEGALGWDMITENAATTDFAKLQQPISGHQSDCDFAPAEGIVILYCQPCNPFHLGDVDVLVRARKALNALPHVAVLGALVVPWSDDALRQCNVSDQRRLPFAVRRSAASDILRIAEQDGWIAVDPCMEGSMKGATGSLVPYIRDYARCKLSRGNWEVRVLEVCAQDPRDCPSSITRGNNMRVPVACYGKKRRGQGASPPAGFLGLEGAVVVDVPKQEHFNDLLQCAVAQAHDSSWHIILERACGSKPACLIRDWATRSRGGRGRRRAAHMPAVL